jgi:hypothetical protein
MSPGEATFHRQDGKYHVHITHIKMSTRIFLWVKTTGAQG